MQITLSLTIVFAILLWTVSLNMAQAQCLAGPYDEAMQDLKARFDQQERIYNLSNARAALAPTLEAARIYATQAAAAAFEANRILDMKTVLVASCIKEF